MQSIRTPAKSLLIDITSITGIELWPFQEASDDPWWSGGSAPRNFRWKVVANVSTQNHSGFSSREPFSYNGRDINVGMWIANVITGPVHKIIAIESKSNNQVTLIVEDVLRYNTLRNQASLGQGQPISGFALVFDINDSGEPIIDPVPAGAIGPDFYPNLLSRFQNFNEQFNFQLEQLANGFELGDIVAIDPNNNEFVLADGSFKTVIGKVTYVGPGPDRFFIAPVQKVFDRFDALPGDIGDTLFVDSANPGQLSLTGEKAVYVKLRNNTQTSTLGTVANPTTGIGDEFTINGTLITVGGSGTLSDVVTAINNETATTDVTAGTAPVPTTVETTLTLIYGQVGLVIDPTIPTATINGTTITFDIDDQGISTGNPGVALEEDIVAAINRDLQAASVTNIFAEVLTGTSIRITNTSGGAINIVNVTNDSGGNPVAGANSGTGLELTTAASTDEVLTLTAVDARAIDLRNVTGTPIQDLGIWSVENGVKAAALYVEQGLRDGTTTVVADIAGRDALTPMVGDQAYVLDRGNGEWALFLWDGGQWVQVADEDSARTDADSLSLTITEASSAEELIGTVSNNSRVTLITVTVTQAFDGGPEMTIGDAGDNNRLMGDDQIDLTVAGTYTTQSNHLYTPGPGIDTDLNVYFDAGGSTTGSATIVVTYV